jgi:hypothetical protein
VRGTLGRVGARYSFTDDALANLRLFGVTPGEVWEALPAPAGSAEELIPWTATTLSSSSTTAATPSPT